jgi:hypothetical protein
MVMTMKQEKTMVDIERIQERDEEVVVTKVGKDFDEKKGRRERKTPLQHLQHKFTQNTAQAVAVT